MSSVMHFKWVAAALLSFVAAGCAAGTTEKANVNPDPTSAQSQEAPPPERLSLNQFDPLLVAPSPEKPSGNMDQSGMKMDAPTPAAPEGSVKPATIYTCPMHPEVRLPAPGKCPICGMKLIPLNPSHKGGK